MGKKVPALQMALSRLRREMLRTNLGLAGRPVGRYRGELGRQHISHGWLALWLPGWKTI
jgi:hypothetical protein